MNVRVSKITKVRELIPIGVLIFTHPDSDLGIVERVPYMDENILCDDFEKALDNGCNPANIYPYVCSARSDIAERLFAIMQDKVGTKYAVYQLCKENLYYILGIHTFVLEN